MKKLLLLLLTAGLLLTACGKIPARNSQTELPADQVEITLNGQDITVSGGTAEQTGVFISRDIVYYEEKTAYESGNPYGEGQKSDMHSAGEAQAHLVVNITAPGTYRLSGKLDLGQIRIDLGEGAYEDPNAVVDLILDGADITCTVGPAILFQNVYECDGEWSEDLARPDVDTAAAGANLILADGSINKVSGSHVAKIYKDKDGEKKLWKQDGAIYSYMSMNVFGPGALNLYADNEGLDTELHLTIHSGDIRIRSGNDGINTNEDGVSVTTINGGFLHITAGLGSEGDGIDSNGYLVINGGTVISCAHPASDAGLDSDLGSYIHGGTVVAMGSAMDWAESDSDQVTMNLQFAQTQPGSALVVTREDGSVVFAYDPAEDEALGENIRQYSGAVISCPEFQVGESYFLYAGGTVSGSENWGIYDVSSVTGCEGGIPQAYTGTDVLRGPGGFGGPRPGEMGGFGGPGGMEEREPPEKPEGGMPEGEIPPMIEGQMPPGGWKDEPNGEDREPGFLFYMQDKVNFFSGIAPMESK